MVSRYGHPGRRLVHLGHFVHFGWPVRFGCLVRLFSCHCRLDADHLVHRRLALLYDVLEYGQLWLRCDAMSDVDNQMGMLQRKLAVKTSEIEMLVAKELSLGDLNSMDDIDQVRLRTHVEELIYQWQEANVRVPGSIPIRH
jgi:hypothetical protein